MIATGRTTSLESFVSNAFAFYGLNWKDHVQIDKSLFRPSDIRTSQANPAKAKELLGWIAQTNVAGVINKMCEAAGALIRVTRG